MMAKRDVTVAPKVPTSVTAYRVPMIALIALAVLAVIPPSAQAQDGAPEGGCSAGGAIAPLPSDDFSCDEPILEGTSFSLTYRVLNISVDDQGTPVLARITSDVTGTLACDDSLCLVQLPDTLAFFDVGGDGCEARAVGVNGCSAGGDNTVIIEIAGGPGVVLPLFPTVLDLVTFRVTAVSAINPGECSEFFTRAETAVGGIVIDDPACNPGITGQAGGSSLLFIEVPVELESFEID